jgi:Ion channel
MLRRFLGAIRHAVKEENFAAVAGAAVVLILVGTVTYSLGEGWNVADGFYFAVSTLTTSSIADPDLTLTHEALKLFTAIYVLTGIGILVELARELGVGYMREREERHAARHARRHKEDPPETQSAG